MNTRNMSDLNRARAAALRGQTPRARGEMKVKIALDWIYNWGWSSPSIIDAISGNKGRGLSSRMVKSGLLHRVRICPDGFLIGVPTFALLLTKAGLDEAIRLSPNESLLNYDLEPRDLARLAKHSYTAQKLTLSRLLSDEMFDFETELDMAAKSTSGVKQPDVVWHLRGEGHERSVAVEVELSPKWERDLDDFVSKCLKSIVPIGGNAARFDRLLIVTDSPALKNRYERAFAAGNYYWH